MKTEALVCAESASSGTVGDECELERGNSMLMCVCVCVRVRGSEWTRV